MKEFAFAILIAALPGCMDIPPTNPDLAAVTGVLIEGEPVASICLRPLGATIPPEDANAVLVFNSIETPLQKADLCFNHPESAFLPQSGQHFTLEIEQGGVRQSAHVVIPPSPENVAAESVIFNVSATIEHPATGVSWDPIAGHFFALRLEPLDDPLIPIPFSGITGGKFELELEGKQSEPAVALFNTDFTFYGNHRLTIYSFDKDYAGVFDYLPQFGGTVLGLGPGNFDVGPGFLTAAGKAEIYFEIVP